MKTSLTQLKKNILIVWFAFSILNMPESAHSADHYVPLVGKAWTWNAKNLISVAYSAESHFFKHILPCSNIFHAAFSFYNLIFLSFCFRFIFQSNGFIQLRGKITPHFFRFLRMLFLKRENKKLRWRQTLHWTKNDVEFRLRHQTAFMQEICLVYLFIVVTQK